MKTTNEFEEITAALHKRVKDKALLTEKKKRLRAGKLPPMTLAQKLEYLKPSVPLEKVK